MFPTQADVLQAQGLYRAVFATQQGRELIELWIEQIMFANPRSTDPNECIAFAVKCAFIEDIVKALDKAENPGKYQDMDKPPAVGAFDPRKAA
jgi:hypothetical protein